jgi:hypothetical protein
MIRRTDTWCCVRREHRCDCQTEKKTERIKKPGRMSWEVEARKKLVRLEND